MSYFLRQTKKSKGIYLQMYDCVWDKETKKPHTSSVKAFGYVDDLISDEIPDPITYYTEYVKNENQKRKDAFNDDTRERCFRSEKPIEIFAGHFLLDTLMEELEVKEDMEILASKRNFQFSTYDLLKQLIFARVLKPCSKAKTVSSVFPALYNSKPISEDQTYDGLLFLGKSYDKYIQLFNKGFDKYFTRNVNYSYFDCSNFYFEIDIPWDDKQKGPSKEGRMDPIIGQALLLDSDLIPIAMEMFPGNESEKPFLRKNIEKMKRKYKVDSKVIQVADKGLNCAKNIYDTINEASDGYIFSKSIHGTGLSDKEKEWVTMDNENNRWKEYRDSNGKLLYKLKYCVDEFDYHFKEKDPETGKDKVTNFKAKEKRVVSYNPALAEKQKLEIMKQVEKAAAATLKKLAREEIGDCAKYLNVTTKDANGKKISPAFELNNAKIEEDLRLAGYNLLVTSEINLTPEEIYAAYHNLWKIEESFKITKKYLDARPVYLQKRESIYGHFLVCYLALFLLRVMEIKCFKNEVNSFDLINFMRDFTVVNKGDGTYINTSSEQILNEKISKLTGITTLDALYLTPEEIDKIFEYAMLINV